MLPAATILALAAALWPAPAVALWLAPAVALWPAPAVAPWRAPAAPTKVCTVDDPRAAELSGLVATETGYVAINDGQPSPGAARVIYLDRGCRLVGTAEYPTPARDPEDLAVAPDGALWVADIGDNITNEVRRQTIALWRWSPGWHSPPGGGSPGTGSPGTGSPGGAAPVIYRLTYPDGPHDAEALLFTDDGMPIVITKELGREAGLYLPVRPLPLGPARPGQAADVPLRRVGDFTPTSAIENVPLGGMITGAASSPDRRRVALRTYAAVYEWDVAAGDVVATIITGAPRITELADEPQGEAIAYTIDGTAFLTVSDVIGPSQILRYPRGGNPAADPATEGQSGQAEPPAAEPAAPWWLTGIPVRYGVAAAAVGLVIAAAGLAGLRRERRRPASHQVPRQRDRSGSPS